MDRFPRLAAQLLCTVVTLTACAGVPTESGRTPFAARLDGQDFLASQTDFSLYGAGSHLLISGVRAGVAGSSRQVSVQLGGWHGAGTYSLGDPSGGNLGFVADEGTGAQPTGHWETSTTETGQVVITVFDAKAKRVAGTFSFRARGNNGNVITVSEGGFDDRFFVDP